jgi:hypothetical protein
MLRRNDSQLAGDAFDIQSDDDESDCFFDKLRRFESQLIGIDFD